MTTNMRWIKFHHKNYVETILKNSPEEVTDLLTYASDNFGLHYEVFAAKTAIAPRGDWYLYGKELIVPGDLLEEGTFS
jgi:hypothetical protein